MPRTTPPRPLIGVGLMLAAMAILPFIDVLAKFLGQQGLPIFIIVWGRALFAALMTLPFALKAEGASAFAPQRPLHHLVRAVLLFGATFLFFTALKHLPIADALAIFFVNPLVIVILSALVLRETVGPRRWAAVDPAQMNFARAIRAAITAFCTGSFLRASRRLRSEQVSTSSSFAST